MLGIRLDPETEQRLGRYARESGRPKSVIARDWIVERLERESVDDQMRRAAVLIARTTTPEELAQMSRWSAEHLRMLDEEDGGYDWGPNGPPS